MESILNNKENNIDPKTGKFFPLKKREILFAVLI